MTTRTWRTMLFFVALVALALVSSIGHASSVKSALPLAQERILRLDLGEAERILARLPSSHPAVRRELGRLRIYQGRFDDAVRVFADPVVAQGPEGASLADVARGSARATAATRVERDARHRIEVRFQDDADEALFPLIVSTVVRARESLTRDLGVDWPLPTRIVVVRDLLSLSAMTGLPYASAKTTGTVAIAKWGRVTMLSPRASVHGYAWLDTLTHELAHLAVTRASSDRAPLWLQEGIAKRQEVRWRSPGPFDDRPPPDAVVARGRKLGIDYKLNRLGPSLAMLPSADAAMVAFAEVTSFVRFLVETGPPDRLPRLLTALRTAKDVDHALEDVTSKNLAGWDSAWRAAKSGEQSTELESIYGLGSAPPADASTREPMRLAELLERRGHHAAARHELERIHRTDGIDLDPALRALAARVLFADGDADAADARIGLPPDVAASFGPWWAMRGQLDRHAGRGERAELAFIAAVAADPFHVDAACEGARDVPRNPTRRVLCESARDWDRRLRVTPGGAQGSVH